MKRYLLFYFSVFISANCLALANSWIQKTTMPGVPRVSAVAFSINNMGYVGTGQDSAGNLLTDFWQYNATNDTWKQVADFGGSARRSAVAFAVNGFGYVGTGYDGANNLTDFFKYDPTLNSWSEVDSMDQFAADNGRRDACAFSAGPYGYVVGGYDGTSDFNNETWQYNEADSVTWTMERNFPSNGRRWGIAFSIEGYGFAGMGYTYTVQYWNDLWKYDTLANAWTQMANYPGSSRGNAVAFTVGDSAFVGTGFNGIYQKDFFIYNYDSNAWSAIVNYGGGITSGAVAFSAGGNGYVSCGEDSIQYKNELWEYTTDTTLGIKNIIPANMSINVFPNPVNDELHLSFFGVKATEAGSYLSLIDASGQTLWTKYIANIAQEPTATVSVDGVAKGVYTLQLKTTAMVITKTFIKE